MTTPPTGTRTGLAWQRTGLGLIAIAALVGARALNTGEEVLLVIAGGAAVRRRRASWACWRPMRQRQLRRRTAADETSRRRERSRSSRSRWCSSPSWRVSR